jgi:hypothetical protein
VVREVTFNEDGHCGMDDRYSNPGAGTLCY